MTDSRLNAELRFVRSMLLNVWYGLRLHKSPKAIEVRTRWNVQNITADIGDSIVSLTRLMQWPTEPERRGKRHNGKRRRL